MNKTISLLSTFACISLFVFSAQGSVLTVKPSLTVDTAYTDNASLSRNDKETDFITTVSPSINMEWAQKHMGIELFYDFQHEFYWDKTENNSSRHSAGLTGWAELSKRTKVTLGERFMRVEDPLREQDRVLLPDEDPFLIRDNIVRRSREPYYTYNSSAGLEHQFGENDFVNLNYLFSLRDDKAPDGNNYKRHTPGIGIAYWITPQFGINASVDYTRARFEKNGTQTSITTSEDDNYDDLSTNLKLIRKLTKHFSAYVSYRHVIRDFQREDQYQTIITQNNLDSDYQIYSPSAGFSYEIDKNTSVTLGVGYFYQDFKIEEDEKGLFADTSITRNWKFQRGGFRLSGNSGIDRNDFGSQRRGFERYYELMGKFDYELAKRLGGNLGAGFRRNEFINNKSSRTSSTKQDDNEIENRCIFDAGLNYKPYRWMTVFANYTHSLLYSNNDNSNTLTQTSDNNNNKLDDNSRVAVGLTFIPREWLFINLSYSHSRLNTDLADGEDHEENQASISVTVTPERPYRWIY